MDHQNTIPSILGPITRPVSLGSLSVRELDEPETPVLMKVVFWVALSLLAYGAVKFFAR